MVSTSTPARYSRSITPSEWWKSANLPGLAEEVQICVEGDGVIDPPALTAAVTAASEACPGARLIRRGRQWVDSGTPPAVKVAQAASFDRQRLDSPLLRSPLTCYRSSCEVILVQGAPSTVIFRAHPGVMDGQGLMLWQRQVFRALRDETLEGATSRLTCDDTMAAIADRLSIDLSSIAAPQPVTKWRCPLGRVPTGPRRSLWRRRTIDGIHPGVAAKIARLVTAYGDGDKEGLVEIPVDLRQYLPGLRTTAAVTGKVDILVREDDDWSEVHARLLTALGEHQFLAYRGNPADLSMPQPFLRELVRWMDNTARHDHDGINEQKRGEPIAGVSHVGTVDLADFSADGFQATSCYALGNVGRPEFDIVECRGRTEVTLAWRDGPGVRERAEALLDWIADGMSPRGYRVWDGNQTHRPTPPATLTGLFADQVRRTPAAVAVSGPDGDLTYAQLSQHAAAIAAALAARGIGRGDRVGLVAGRSPAAIAAIWGILAAGAAYLPIDASYPDARITQLLTDGSATACLLEPPAAQRGLLPPGCQPIPLDTIPPGTATPWPRTSISPDDLACVIYTSGSTGAPKGVEIEHRSLVNYVRWATRDAAIDATAKMPLIASISFDMAGCAIFLPLLSGGTVLPVREVNAATLREVIEDRGATALAITPSHLEMINQSGIRHSAMRVIMTAGELLLRTTALRARDIFGPHCRILCQWGPTETTIVNTSHEFDPDRDTEPGVPFGRPMDNNTVHLLDSRGRFVPPGEPGEAYVGGIQVARGYLGRPDLTRQRFIHFADGTRAYRTGDIARLLPTGELSFISRADDQVKVAGHRIEPAEISQALENHPHVRQAAVIPRTRPGRHDKELCAYVVTDPPATPDELRHHLAAQLPPYMVPAAILTVPAIPRTPNGKTDPRQLPDPFARITATRAAAPEHDDITTAIASIWAQTLQIEPHLLDDQADFRELGGNSVLMLTMIDEVSRTVAADAHAEFMAELARILRKPTLGHVCELIRQARTKYTTGHTTK